MVELVSGSIHIDDTDITQIPRQEIRSRINGVSQDPLLIKGSVRLNADPTERHSDKTILEALKSVQLLSTVKEKGGLDTEIENLFLSHGQKQLFCLARAILRPGNILVLDEATSKYVPISSLPSPYGKKTNPPEKSVDTKTDEIMQRIIREKFSTHTILTVAHKLDTILDYDRVLVLDGGRVIESGEPFELLASESHFSRLYASSVVEE